MKKQSDISLRHNPYVHIKNATSGITLIALVITIIVLLILAGVSIASVTGNDGMLTRAEAAVEKTRAAEIKEMVDLAVSQNFLAAHTNGVTKTKAEIIAELKTAGKITAAEEATLTSSDKITIAGTEIDFSVLSNTNTTPEEEQPTQYTVTFCNYDGTELYKVTVNEGGTAVYPGETTPTRAKENGYIYMFSKWVTQKDGTTTAELTNITGNKTVYAFFESEYVGTGVGSIALPNGSNSVTLQVNGIVSTDLNYNYNTTTKYYTFTYSGNKEVLGYEFPGMTEGGDYEIISESDDCKEIVIELINNYSGEVVANAIVM